MKIAYIPSAIIAGLILFTALRPGAAAENVRPYSVQARCGSYIPLDEMDKRATVWLPYFSIAFRVSPPAEWSRYLVLEVEAGFYAYRQRQVVSGILPASFTGYRVKTPRRTCLYSEPVLAGVLGNFEVYRGFYLMPGFSAGMMFNQVRNGTSPGSYNHIACAAGIEAGYRISDLISANIRIRAVFGFDKDRVFYHIVPDAGISFHF